VSSLLPLLQIIGVVYCFGLPGWLVAVQLDEEWSTTVRMAVGFALGALIVPSASFGAAWLLGTNVRPLLVVGVSTLFNVAGFASWWLRGRRAAPGRTTPENR